MEVADLMAHAVAGCGIREALFRELQRVRGGWLSGLFADVVLQVSMVCSRFGSGAGPEFKVRG